MYVYNGTTDLTLPELRCCCVIVTRMSHRSKTKEVRSHFIWSLGTSLPTMILTPSFMFICSTQTS